MSAENSDLNPFELWDENELATRLGVPVTTVKSWRSRGGGPDWVRLGGKKARYRPQAVLEWLQRREQNVPTGEAS